MPKKKKSKHKKHKQTHKNRQKENESTISSNITEPDVTPSTTRLGKICEIGKSIVSSVKGVFSSRPVTAIPKGAVGKEAIGATTSLGMGTHIVSDVLTNITELDVGAVLSELPKKDASLFLTRFACSYLAYNKKSYGGSNLLQDPETMSWMTKMYGPDSFRKWLGYALANTASYVKGGLNTGICFALSFLANEEKALFSLVGKDDQGNYASWGTALAAASAVAIMGAIKTGVLEHVENKYVQFYIGGEILKRHDELTKVLQSLPDEKQQWDYIKTELKELGKGLDSKHIDILANAIKESLLPEKNEEVAYTPVRP